MGVVNSLVEYAHKFLDKGDAVDAWLTGVEKPEETDVQQLQHKAQVQQAFEDIHRLERIMARRE